MKVYIVTDGDYSDYHIVAAYTDPIQADKYVATYSGRVEEYDTDPETVYPPAGYWFYDVEMLKDGTVVTCRKKDNEECEPYDLTRAEYLYWYPAVYSGTSLYRLGETGVNIPLKKKDPNNYFDRVLDHYDGAVMWTVILAKDEQHAIKIANEKRAQLIANGKWEKEKG